MRLYYLYDQFKFKHRDCVILVKSGTFYCTYDNDAQIIHSYFGYQIRDNKVGFPETVLEKVKSRLKSTHVNYIVVEREEKIYVFDDKDNKYYNQLEIARNKISYENKLKDLHELMDSKIKENESNFEAIEEFINEL